MAVRFSYTPPKVDARALLAAAVPEATDEIAQTVLDASQPGVPVEEGTLKKSGRVVPEGLRAYVTYGKDDDGDDKHAPSNQYTVKQHEDMDLDHPNGGGAKWLELAMHDESVKTEGLVRAAAVLRGALGL